MSLDNCFFSFIGETRVPKINPLLANGLAVEHMKHVEAYVDKILRCVSEGFPEGLRYVGMQRCTPKEEYAETVKKKNSIRRYEIAKSNVYMVKCIFTWRDDEKIIRYLYLPYVNDGGLINILGALYAISPVLTDKAISAGTNSLFVPLTCTKLTFERTIHHFYINGARASEFVVWSSIYRLSQEAIKNRGRPTLRAYSTLAHYLFCKYGVKETFRRYALTNIDIGDDETITDKTHPANEWFICSSTQLKPLGLARGYYKGSTLRIAVKKSDWSPLVAGLIGGFFYVVDMFPNRIMPEYLGEEEEINLWRILMGHVIFATNVSEGKLLVDINIHIDYLDGYMDALAQETLATADVHVEDFYQLLIHIIETFPERIMSSADSIGSMYDKRLSVLRYITMPITKAGFNLMFRLRKASNKPLNTADDIINIMNKIFKTDLIMGINRDHGEVKPIASSGDNKIFNITSALVLQANSNAGDNTNVKSSLFDPGRQLHASIAEVGSLTHLPKSEPSGRSRFNPCVRISPDGSILRDPNKAALIESVQEKIKR